MIEKKNTKNHQTIPSPTVLTVSSHRGRHIQTPPGLIPLGSSGRTKSLCVSGVSEPKDRKTAHHTKPQEPRMVRAGVGPEVILEQRKCKNTVFHKILCTRGGSVIGKNNMFLTLGYYKSSFTIMKANSWRNIYIYIYTLIISRHTDRHEKIRFLLTRCNTG